MKTQSLTTSAYWIHTICSYRGRCL